MKIPLHIVALFALCATFACSTENNTAPQQETANADTVASSDNPFRLDSVHFADFYHQSDIHPNLRSQDSTYWAISSVSQTIKDSMYVDFDNSQRFLKMGIRNELLNGTKNVVFGLGLVSAPGDTVTTFIPKSRFYQVLSAMKFMRRKIDEIPNRETEITFCENGVLNMGSRFDPKDGEWKTAVILSRHHNDGNARSFILTKEKFDTLLVKLDNFRAFINE